MNKKRKICAVGIAVCLSKKLFQECLVSSDDESDDTNIRTKPLRIENYLEKVIPGMSHILFQSHFRISRTMYDRLLPIINERLCKRNILGRPAMDIEKQLLATLWLLATPDSYRSVGERFDMGKNSLSVAFFRIVNAINTLSPSVIKWPRNVDVVKEKFYSIAGVDNVIGAIDGTFVPIKAPMLDPEVYITRKCNYAITLQAICDSQLHFTDCFVGYPGSVSDTRIFRNSDIYKNILNHVRDYFPNNEFIVGDKAYPVLPWCVPPYIDRGNLNRRKRHFNHIISQTRQVIERAFALLFGRFRRLKFLDMNRTDLIPSTVLACCVLHNLCLHHNDIYIDEYINEGRENVYENAPEDAAHRQLLLNHGEGFRKRDELCEYLYSFVEE